MSFSYGNKYDIMDMTVATSHKKQELNYEAPIYKNSLKQSGRAYGKKADFA